VSSAAATLGEQAERPLRLKPPLATQQLPQVEPVDVRHRQIEPAVLLAEAQDPNDVGIVEARGDLGLSHEPLPEPLVLGQLTAQELQRDSLASRDLPSQIDVPHRPLTDE